jgi:hypothetical protein
MRVIALGRKNFLFAGSDTGGDRAAAIYTIVQTARLNGVNPETYLKDTLTKIAEGHPINKIDQLLPWQISAPAADKPYVDGPGKAIESFASCYPLVCWRRTRPGPDRSCAA